MFCNSCGKELQAGQQFCSACGQPVGVARVPNSANRVREHVKVLGVLWLVYGAFLVLSAFGIMVFASAILPVILANISQNVPNAQIPNFIRPLLTVVLLFVFAKGALCVAAGLGLLQRASWGRITALVAGFLSLINIPFGLAMGIYTIWVLLTADADKQYEKLMQAA
jgi:predicted nucleic acid-binding Zn ribbon protein